MRVVEFDSSTPFKEQLEVIAATGVFVSVHTSNLANALFLQPGSAVVEIIQRNWNWADMDRSFKVLRCYSEDLQLLLTSQGLTLLHPNADRVYKRIGMLAMLSAKC